MKVLMKIRADADNIGGGDVQIMRETAAVLRGLGITVDTDCRTLFNPRSYDIVHLFNTTRINETWQHFKAARAAGVPVVVSTIWHSIEELRKCYAAEKGLPWFPVWTYSAAKEAFYARRSGFPLDYRSVLRYRQCQRDVMLGADMLLPNSEAERYFIEKDLGIRVHRVRVIPNAFNVSLAEAAARAVGERRGVIAAGRIEPRKNASGLISAFKRLPASAGPLHFYGSINEAHSGYARDFRASLQSERIEYLGKVEPATLYHAFARASVAVLASFCETTGLVSLEALACGARIVVSDSPYTREYFRDAAFYCDPFDVASIAEAISRALASPPSPPPEWVKEYTWDNVARLTVAAYQDVLKVRSGASGQD